MIRRWAGAVLNADHSLDGVEFFCVDRDNRFFAGDALHGPLFDSARDSHPLVGAGWVLAFAVHFFIDARGFQRARSCWMSRPVNRRVLVNRPRIRSVRCVLRACNPSGLVNAPGSDRS